MNDLHSDLRTIELPTNLIRQPLVELLGLIIYPTYHETLSTDQHRIPHMSSPTLQTLSTNRSQN